jgi:hypothetical protein
MAKKVDIAERLKELGFDPVDGMVRIAKRAEQEGKLGMAAKIMGDLLEYTAPKLKSMEVSIEPETRDFLDRQARLKRIQDLIRQTRVPVVIDGETVSELPLLHTPDTP